VDVDLFHRKLLGKDQSRTDTRFRLTSVHRQLYTAFANSGVRGYSGQFDPERSASRFLATLVLALFQTQLPGETDPHHVTILLPKPALSWYRRQVEEIARFIFSQRKGQTEAVQVITLAFHHLRRTHHLLQIAEPDRWVIFGFESTDPLPTWVQGHLL